MIRWLKRGILVLLFLLALPCRSPAPLIYVPGEGWSYESVGGEGKWKRNRAKDQLQVAQEAFDQKKFSLAKKASKRVVTIWPLSDYAPGGDYLLARCYEELHQDERAFKAYQNLIQKYPKATNYVEVLHRQYAIANRFLAGQRFKIWGVIPTFASMDKTVGLYDQLIKNGPYSDVAPQAQLNIGAAREKQSRFLNDEQPYVQAAKAYEKAADVYHDKPDIASEALYKEGMAYNKQARRAEYDQGTSEQAINAFKDFMAFYPDDKRVPECENHVGALRTEQAHGSYDIARFYEKRGHKKGALIYYNEVLLQDPKSTFAATALQRIAAINKANESKPAK